MELTHDEIKSLIAPYALGAVPPDEMASVRAHILSCEECMAEADRLTEAAASLALAVEEEPLPAGFEDRVMEAIAPSPQRVSAPAPRRRFSFAWALASAACLLIAGYFALSTFEARDDRDLYRHALSALVRSGEGAQVLSGEGGVAARAVPTDDGTLFVATGFEDPPEDHTYQLWRIDGEKPKSMGTFDVSSGSAIFETGESVEGADGVAVTVEPDGGSLAPTGPPVAAT